MNLIHYFREGHISKLYPKNKNLDAFNIENLIENLANYIPANFKKKNSEEFEELIGLGTSHLDCYRWY